MDYSTYLGDFVTDPLIEEGPIEVGTSKKALEPEFDRPRLGIPSGFLKTDGIEDDIQRVIWRTIKSGYQHAIPKDINPELRMHLEHFRNHLDIYDKLIDKKVFSIQEIWMRSLMDRSEFTSFLKKSRKYSLQAKISLEDTLDEDDNHVHHEYSGYDSIFHEAFLPNWDDSEETEDYIYSMIPERKNAPVIESLVERLMEDYKVPKGTPIVHWLQPIAGKKTVSDTGKTTLLKNTWHLDDEFQGRYFGKRVIVPTYPGSTRDTAVPDVFTLNALKYIGSAAREVSEKLPYSANCTFKSLNKRVGRMKRCWNYLHVDFKKYGLTAPRKVQNAVMRAIGIPELQVKTMLLDIGDDVLQTTRGSALGWLDSLTAIGVIAILYNLRKREGWKDMDFIGFNDDFEIGFGKHPTSELIRRKQIIIAELEAHDFILSHKKIYLSEMMIFLENYQDRFRPRGQGLDMRKLQLVTKQYANSLSTPFKWKAKVCYARAALKIRNTSVRDICQCSIEDRSPAENGRPVELGGWEYFLDKEHQSGRPLNNALEEASVAELSYFLKMQKYKEPHLAPKKEVVDLGKLFKLVERKEMESIRPHYTQYLDRIKLDTSNILSDETLTSLKYSEEGEALTPAVMNPEDGASWMISVDPG
jgi:hypothetical protein